MGAFGCVCRPLKWRFGGLWPSVHLRGHRSYAKFSVFVLSAKADDWPKAPKPPLPWSEHEAKQLLSLLPALQNILAKNGQSDGANLASSSSIMSKIALITGANRGLGLETARQLARDHGFSVLLGARDEAKGLAAQEELGQEGLDAHFVHLDVTDEDSIEKAARYVSQEYGLLDVLVNNAGIMLEHTFQVGGVPSSNWKKTFDVNFFGVVDTTNAMLPLLEKSDAPRIVNLSAILGSLNEISKPQMKQWIRASYSASKAALNAYTVSLAQEHADSKWKINAAHPGWAKTEIGGPKAPMTAAQGVRTVVQLATLGEDGPNGGFLHMSKTMAW